MNSPTSSSTPAAPAPLPVYFTGADLREIAQAEIIGASFEMFTAAKVLRKTEELDSFKRIYKYDTTAKQFVRYTEVENSGIAIRVASALNACEQNPVPLTLHVLKSTYAEVNLQKAEISELKKANKRYQQERDEAITRRDDGMAFRIESNPRGLHDFAVSIPGHELIRMSAEEIAYQVARQFDRCKRSIIPH